MMHAASERTNLSPDTTANTENSKHTPALNIESIVICDYGYNVKSGIRYALCGATLERNGELCGVFYCNLYGYVSSSTYIIGANLPGGTGHWIMQSTIEDTGPMSVPTEITKYYEAGIFLKVQSIVTCDYGYIRKDSTIVAILGGDSGTQGDTAKNGAFIYHLVYPFAQGVWYVGAI